MVAVSNDVRILVSTIAAWIVLITILVELEHTPYVWLFMVVTLLAYLLSDAFEKIGVRIAKKIGRGVSLFVRFMAVFVAIVISGLIGLQLEPSVAGFLASQGTQGSTYASIISATLPITLVTYLMLQSDEFKAFMKAFWDRWNAV